MAWSWPTILRRNALSKSRASLLRRVGSSTVLSMVFIGSGPSFPFLGLHCFLGERVQLFPRGLTNFVICCCQPSCLSASDSPSLCELPIPSFLQGLDADSVKRETLTFRGEIV